MVAPRCPADRAATNATVTRRCAPSRSPRTGAQRRRLRISLTRCSPSGCARRPVRFWRRRPTTANPRCSQELHSSRVSARTTVQALDCSREAIAKLTAAGDGRAQVLLLGMVLAALEARTPKDAWRHAPSSFRPAPGVAEYLRFLAATATRSPPSNTCRPASAVLKGPIRNIAARGAKSGSAMHSTAAGDQVPKPWTAPLAGVVVHAPIATSAPAGWSPRQFGATRRIAMDRPTHQPRPQPEQSLDYGLDL